LRLFSIGGYGLALAALALVVFGAYDSYPNKDRVSFLPEMISKFHMYFNHLPFQNPEVSSAHSMSKGLRTFTHS